jgi:hypothetical protein
MAIATTFGGRKSKGERVFRGARLPEYVDEALVDAAEREGLSISDLIANAVAARYGLPLVAEPTPGLFQPEELALRAG